MTITVVALRWARPSSLEHKDRGLQYRSGHAYSSVGNRVVTLRPNDEPIPRAGHITKFL
jgi:hypothetical protein